MKYGSLFTRAFKKENAITLWAVNNSSNAIDANVKVNGAVTAGNAAFRQWTVSGSSNGVPVTAASGVSVAISARTVMMIIIPIAFKQ